MKEDMQRFGVTEEDASDRVRWRQITCFFYGKPRRRRRKSTLNGKESLMKQLIKKKLFSCVTGKKKKTLP